MLGPLPLLLVPLTVLNFEDRSEVRVRPVPGDVAALDLSNAATVGLLSSGPQNSVGIAYSPAFTYYQVGGENSAPALFHTATVNFSHSFRRAFLTLSETASAGQNNFRVSLATPPAAAAPTDPDAPSVPSLPPTSGLPPNQSGAQDALVWFGSSRTVLGVGEQVGDRTTLFQTVYYGVQSGLDETARQNYPLQLSIGGSLGFGHQLTKRDALATTVVGERVETSKPVGGSEVPPRNALIISVGENWTRQLSRSLTAQLIAGGSWTRDQAGSDAPSTTVYPVGSISVVGTLPYRSTLRSTAGVAPQVDRFSGAIDYRGSWSILYTQVRRRFLWSVGTFGASSFDLESPTSLATAGVSGTIVVPLNRVWSFDSRAGTSWQLLGQSGSDPFLWTLALGLIFRPLPERL